MNKFKLRVGRRVVTKKGETGVVTFVRKGILTVLIHGGKKITAHWSNFRLVKSG